MGDEEGRRDSAAREPYHEGIHDARKRERIRDVGIDDVMDGAGFGRYGLTGMHEPGKGLGGRPAAVIRDHGTRPELDDRAATGVETGGFRVQHEYRRGRHQLCSNIRREHRIRPPKNASRTAVTL